MTYQELTTKAEGVALDALGTKAPTDRGAIVRMSLALMCWSWTADNAGRPIGLPAHTALKVIKMLNPGARITARNLSWYASQLRCGRTFKAMPHLDSTSPPMVRALPVR